MRADAKGNFTAHRPLRERDDKETNVPLRYGVSLIIGALAGLVSGMWIGLWGILVALIVGGALLLFMSGARPK